MIISAVGFGGLLTTIILYPALYPDSTNIPWLVTFGESCILLLTFFIALAFRTKSDKPIKICNNEIKIEFDKHKTTGWFLIAFAFCQFFTFFYRLYHLGLFYDMGLSGIRVGCSDITLNGNPIKRYEYFGPLIDTKQDCVFNSFVETNINGGNLTDWSDYKTYDMDLLSVARSAGSQEIEIPKYHHVWYWGCHKICTERYDVNRIWLYNSIVLCFVYIGMSIYYFATRQETVKAINVNTVGTSAKTVKSATLRLLI
jgi:hypothetical protein